MLEPSESARPGPRGLRGSKAVPPPPAGMEATGTGTAGDRAVRPAARPRPRRAPRADRRRLSPLVLLVDDLEEQRDLYRQYLEFVGFRVATARDGFEGIDRALTLHPDVAVMDLAMPR